MKFFWGLLAIIFYQTDYWNYEIPVDDYLFCIPIAAL